MREKFSEALKQALKARETRKVSTIRLIQAAIKDRDIAHRSAGKDPVGEEDIQAMLAKMVKQREESARIYEDAGRVELAEQEREEIAVIRDFMPTQLSDEEVESACASVVADTGAQGLRDMGKCMNALKERYPGQMDFSKASGKVKQMLR